MASSESYGKSWDRNAAQHRDDGGGKDQGQVDQGREQMKIFASGHGSPPNGPNIIEAYEKNINPPAAADRF
jgi:hypothetical protein